MTMDNSIVPEQLRSFFDEAIEVLQEKIISAVRDEMASATADRLLDKEEAAGFLGIQPCTISKWITDGTAPKYCKLGSRVLFKREWLNDFVERKAIDNLKAPDTQRNQRAGGR
jgi:excisionase family DNA binding protein